jgi:hypothetical protein
VTPTTGRSPPILDRVVCPLCGRFWFRYPPTGDSEYIEILCRGRGINQVSQHLILFRVVDGKPIVEAAHDRDGNPIQR